MCNVYNGIGYATDRHLTWILLVFNKLIVLEKNIEWAKKMKNFYNLFKRINYRKGFMKKC